MKKIRITKISGDKLIKVLSTKGNRTEKYVQGYINEIYSKIPTIGYPFGIYNRESNSHGISSFRTSPVREILSENTFKTDNSIYKWEEV